jgi:hypothetical protein
MLNIGDLVKYITVEDKIWNKNHVGLVVEAQELCKILWYFEEEGEIIVELEWCRRKYLQKVQ